MFEAKLARTRIPFYTRAPRTPFKVWHLAQIKLFCAIFFKLAIDKRFLNAIIKVQKDKNKQKMLALNILTNN